MPLILQKNKTTRIYSAITLVVGLLAADLLFGILVFIFDLSPKINDLSLGAQGYHLEPHPFRSYRLVESTRQRWVDEKMIINSKEYDYSLLQNGTITNHYGHQILESDSRIDMIPKHNKEVRIFFSGGSTTYQPWPHLLQIELKALYPDVDTKAINAGVGGYTSMENMIDITTTASAYNPDIVIAYLPINDVYWATAYEDDWIAHDYTHMRTEFKINEKEDLELKLKPQKLIDLRYPYTAAFVLDSIYAMKLNKYLSARSLSHSVLKDGWSFNPTRASETKVDELARIIARNIFLMQNFCEFQGCKFIFLTQKLFRYQQWSNSKYTPLTERVIDRVIEQIPAEITVIRLDKIFPDKWNKNDIQLVKEWYKDREMQPAKDFTSYFSYDDMHFSPEALVLLAKKLAPKIAEFGRLYN